MSNHELIGLRKQIESEHGAGALELTNILIQAFKVGMSDDILKGRDRFDELGETSRNAASRVASALKNLIQESSNVDYLPTTHQIYYTGTNGSQVTFESNSELGDSIYEVMEVIHSLPPSKLKKKNGRYLSRDRYDSSLNQMIYSIAYAKES